MLFRASNNNNWIALKSGDILIIAHPTDFWMTTDTNLIPLESVSTPYTLKQGLADYGGQDNILLAGKMSLLASSSSFLLSFLPSIIHIPSESSGTLVWLMERLHAERLADLPGADAAGTHLVELVMLEALRYAIRTAQADKPGLLRALRDEKIRRVLDAIHSSISRDWSLQSMADVARMSRTRFAERFREVVGVPPASYLSMWRMQLACRKLAQEKESVKEIAFDLGFGSVSAFSTAFRRLQGVSPSEWLIRHKATLKDRLQVWYD